MPRDHLLLHSGEDTIHDPKQEKKDLTPKDKRKNFWFYHKWHFVIGAVVILFAVILVKDFFDRTDPDYQVAMLVETSYPEDTIMQLQDYLEAKANDRNNDGEVVVQVNQYVLAFDEETASGSSGSGEESQVSSASDSGSSQETSSEDTSSGYVDPNTQMASFVKFSMDTKDDVSMIYLVGEDCLDYYQNTFHLFAKSDYSSPDMDSTDNSNIGTPWEDYDYLDSLTFMVSTWDEDYNTIDVDVTVAFQDLRVCIRDKEQLSGKDHPDTIAYYDDSVALLESLKTK